MILDEVRLIAGRHARRRRAGPLTAAAIAGAIVAALIVVAGVPAPWALALIARLRAGPGARALDRRRAVRARLPGRRARSRRRRRPAGRARRRRRGAGPAPAACRRRRASPSPSRRSRSSSASKACCIPARPSSTRSSTPISLDTVLAGNYFFTQPMPSGVEFPYAIGLYVMAAPWAGLTRDHVLLLRIVVATVARARGAVALPAGAVDAGRTRGPPSSPSPPTCWRRCRFVVIGNANQTYAFGQSIATIALASAMTWRLGWRRPVAAAGLVALLSLGLLSHVGLIPLLGGLVGRQRRAAGLARRRRGPPRRLGDPRAPRSSPRSWRSGSTTGTSATPSARRSRSARAAAARPSPTVAAGRIRPVGSGSRPGRAGRDVAAACGPDAPPGWRSRPTAHRSSCSRSSASPGCRSAPDGTAPP